MGGFAFVLKIGNRYFCRFGKNGQVQTAWSLAGAMFFMDAVCSQYKDVVRVLDCKGKNFVVVRVGDLDLMAGDDCKIFVEPLEPKVYQADCYDADYLPF